MLTAMFWSGVRGAGERPPSVPDVAPGRSAPVRAAGIGAAPGRGIFRPSVLAAG